MRSPLALKLGQFTRLSPTDRLLLDQAAAGHVRHYAAGQDVIAEGEKPREINLILSGWGCRYKQIDDGRRQIVGFCLPGDLCDLNVFVLREMDHTVGAITALNVAELSREGFETLTTARPRIAQALWWEALVNIAIQREWTLNVGQRDARERIGHLLCELFLRLRSIGLTDADGCEFPLTQIDLAAATGLSAVHVNRTLQELRHAGLVVLRGKHLAIPDLAALMRASKFNPNYLHLDRVGGDLDTIE